MYIYIITNCQGENVNLKVVLEFIGIILSKKLDQMHIFPLKTSKTLIQNLEFDLKMIHNWTYLAFPQSDSRWKMLPIHWAVESERLFPGESFFKDTPEDVKSPQVRGPFIPVATMESVVFLEHEQTAIRHENYFCPHDLFQRSRDVDVRKVPHSHTGSHSWTFHSLVRGHFDGQFSYMIMSCWSDIIRKLFKLPSVIKTFSSFMMLGWIASYISGLNPNRIYPTGAYFSPSIHRFSPDNPASSQCRNELNRLFGHSISSLRREY